MTTQQPPAQFDWATELLDAQGHVTLSAKEAHEIGARLRSFGEKLKSYEDLDEAASDVQLLRMGYAAARLEIESLQARIKTMAEEHADELMVAHLDGRSKAAQPTDAMLGEQAELRRLSDCCPELNLSNYGPDDVDELNGWAIEVSQCIDRALAAQPAGAQAAPELTETAVTAKNPAAPVSSFEDSRTQAVYEVLVNDNYPPAGSNEHWEGWKARLIVDALFPIEAPAAGAVAGAGEVVAHRVMRKSLSGEWASDARDWSDGPPSRALVDSIRADKGRWRIDVAYAAPTTQPAPPTHGLRASHGQAPAQAAPAAVAGTHVTDAMALAFHSALSDGAIGSDEVEETKVGLRAALAAAPTTQPAPQQEAQEPVAWYVTGCSRLLDEDEAKAEARHIGGTARAMPLYTVPHADSQPAPQPSPASQGDALDAARLDWLALAGPTSICVVIDREHDGEVEVSTDDVTGYGKTLREALDAARKQGANHD